MIPEGPIIRVEFSMTGGFSDRWNVNLGFFGARVIPADHISDAMFEAKEMFNSGPLNRLLSERAHRDQLIERHFAACAKRLIEQIEKKEGWKESLG